VSDSSTAVLKTDLCLGIDHSFEFSARWNFDCELQFDKGSVAVGANLEPEAEKRVAENDSEN
jgi:hypothetical protein